jgi:hypothetical protein
MTEPPPAPECQGNTNPSRIDMSETREARRARVVAALREKLDAEVDHHGPGCEADHPECAAILLLEEDAEREGFPKKECSQCHHDLTLAESWCVVSREYWCLRCFQGPDALHAPPRGEGDPLTKGYPEP